jgi:hypothetical protein
LYREAGWLGALPLPKGKKNPPPKGYTGAGKEYPTEAKVESWLSNKEICYGNIGLRLAEVDREFWPSYLPAVYAGNAPDGWELIGIDIDDYKGKEGGNQREALEYQLDCELPATALSSARWGSGGSSCIAIYFVPKGYRFMGKAADSIEIVQKRHRYMVAWPSVNPDAPTTIAEVDGKRVAVPARYSWRYGKPSDVGGSTAAGSAGSGLVVDIDGIPSIKPSEAGEGVAVLPEAWFKYLSRQGERETDDAISSLSEGELSDWVKNELRWEGEPCKRVSNALAKAVAELEDSPDSHTWLNSFLWQLFNLAAEGHSGIGQAYSDYMNAWVEHAGEHRGASPEDLQAEIDRSVMGALSKIEPKYVVKPDGAEYADDNEAVKHLPLRDDICVGNEIENVDRLGPIIGPMTINPGRPADSYDQCDRGNAIHFADLYGGNMHYYSPLSKWVFWTGERWEATEQDTLACMAFDRVRYEQASRAVELWADVAMYDPGNAETKGELKEATNAAKRMDRWYLQSGDRARVKNAVDMVKGEYRRDKDALDEDGRLTERGVLKGVLLTDELFDQKPNLFACKNGVLDLDDVEAGVRPQRKDDYISMNTGVPYISWKYIVNGDPITGEYPTGSPIPKQYQTWMSYLDLVLPLRAEKPIDSRNVMTQETLDQQAQKLRDDVQMVLGYTLIGGNPDRKLIFVEGSSTTGKTTMLKSIRKALGDYAGTGDESVFQTSKFNESLAANVMKRVMLVSELEDGLENRLKAKAIKRIAGDEGGITLREKYKNEARVVEPQFTGLVACNNAPAIEGFDEATLRRMVSVRFNKEILVADRTKAAETVAASIVVLSWLIEGWMKYAKRDAELKADPNAIGGFWENRPKEALLKQAEFSSEMDAETVGVEQFIKNWVEMRCDTKMNATNEFDEAMAQAEAAAKLKGKPLGTSHWAVEWTAQKSDVWDALRADALGKGMRITERGHGAILLEHMGIDPGNNKAARKINGELKAVYVGVRLRHNNGKLGKW